MHDTVLKRLCCPVCRGSLAWEAFLRRREGEIEHGVAWCRACRTWYPIEAGLLELLPPDLAYRDDKEHFWNAHRRELHALDLEEPDAAIGLASAGPQRKQQAHFDWYAGNDQQSYTAYERMPFWQAVDAGVFADWRQRVRPGGWLLDVGCAQGRSTFRFMDLPLHVVGFDVAKAPVRQALAQYRSRPHRAQATFFVGDASRLPFVKHCFDYVLVYGVLHHLPDPARTCRDLARVLKPGGLYFGCENNQTAFRRVFDLVMQLNPLWHEEAGAQPLIAARQLAGWFTGSRIKVKCHTRVFVLPHLVNWLGRRWGTRLLNLCEWAGRRLPIVRDHGGLLMIRGRKAARRLADPRYCPAKLRRREPADQSRVARAPAVRI
jgi:SAM-dependent methyltransferase/uncharacterized protein YbaR (Trm112 family)